MVVSRAALKCEANQLKLAGKYNYCLLKAQALSVKTRPTFVLCADA
jgi:hypothetical protein